MHVCINVCAHTLYLQYHINISTHTHKHTKWLTASSSSSHSVSLHLSSSSGVTIARQQGGWGISGTSTTPYPTRTLHPPSISPSVFTPKTRGCFFFIIILILLFFEWKWGKWHTMQHEGKTLQYGLLVININQVVVMNATNTPPTSLEWRGV